jgi:hypothetical protein
VACRRRAERERTGSAALLVASTPAILQSDRGDAPAEDDGAWAVRSDSVFGALLSVFTTSIRLGHVRLRLGHPERGRPARSQYEGPIDEALTPDSSRFWPRDAYAPGRSQPSFDKQFVRDYLETLDWDKQPPGPELPPEVVARTVAKYVEAYDRLRGEAR